MVGCKNSCARDVLDLSAEKKKHNFYEVNNKSLVAGALIKWRLNKAQRE